MMRLKYDICTVFLIALSVTFAIQIVCQTASAEEQQNSQQDLVKLTLQAKSFNPREIQIGKDEHCEISFNLNKSAHIKLTILDWDNESVAVREQDLEAGDRKFEWDLKFSGREAFDGPYMYRLEATDEVQARSVYDPGFSDGMTLIDRPLITMDSKTGEVKYNLPRMGMARLRIMRRPALLVRTLQDWTPHLAGDHSVTWDGKDQSGHEIAMNDPQLFATVLAYSLPENAFLITGTGRTKPPRGVKAQQAWRSNPVLLRKYFLAGIPREQNRDPILKLTCLSGDGSKELSEPLEVSSAVKIRMLVNPNEVKYLEDERFEICHFIDGVFVSEDEDGTAPYTFGLRTDGLNTGPHLLSVMLMTTADHVGMASLPFTLKPKSEPESSKVEQKGER